MDGYTKVRLYAESRISEIRREADINGELGTDATRSALRELGNVANFCENARIKETPAKQPVVGRTAVERAAAHLVEAVEKYVRQECLRSELIAAKDDLKKLLAMLTPKK